MKLTPVKSKNRHALVDSTATHNFLQTAAKPSYAVVKNTADPDVAVANGDIITTQYKASIPLIKDYLRQHQKHTCLKH